MAQGTYLASLRTRKTTAQGNLLNDAASQGIFENNENLVGIVHFAGLDLTNKAITAITLEIDAARAGYGIESTKTVFVRKSNYQAASQSGVTGLQYVGAALGSFTGHFYGNRQTVSITGALLTALGEYISQGNNTICLYDANAVQGGQGYSANYLEFDAVTASITYAEGLSTPSVSPSSIVIGESVSISISRLVSTATHKLRYRLGTASGMIAEDVETSKTWTPPASLAEQIAATGSGAVEIYCDTKIGGSVIGTKSASFRITAAASVPTVSPGTVTLGESMTIATNRTSSAAKHKITYTIGAKTGTIATEAGANATWTPGYALAQYFGSGSTATCVITCTTMIGGVQIGTPKTVNVTLKAPVSKPTVSAANVTLGTAVTIYTNRTINTATHKLTYSVGGSTGTIREGVQSQWDWTPQRSLAGELSAKGTKKCTITCETIVNGVSVGTKTVTVTLAVPASTIAAASECYLEDALPITITRAVSTAVHTIRYTAGSAEGVIAENAGTSAQWTPPRSLGRKFGNSATKGCVIYCDTYVGGVLIGSSSAAVTLKIPPSVPTFSKNPVELGTSVTITTNRYSSYERHEIWLQRSAIDEVKIFDDVEGSQAWTPAVATYAPYIINGSDSKVFGIRVVTKIGDTVIGETLRTLTLKVPASVVPVPVLSSITDTDPAIAAQFGGFVQTKSRIRVSAVANPGQDYGAMSTITYTTEGKTYQNNAESDVLMNAGARTVRITAKDQRGRTATIQSSYTVLTYRAPKITTFTAERCSDDGSQKKIDGTKVRFTAIGSIAGVYVDGTAKNTRLMQIYVREQGSGTWTLAETYTTNLGWNFDKENVLLGGTFNVLSGFELKCEVTDFFETVTAYASVPSKQVMISLPRRGNGIAFGKIAERSNYAEFGWRLWLQYALDIAMGGTGATTRLEAQTNLLRNIEENESGITEANDLNSLKTIGNYFVYGDVSTDKHYPRTATSMRCMIYVSGAPDLHLIQTVAYIMPEVEIYTRMFNATSPGTWTDWIRISGSTPFVNATLAANVSNSPNNRGNGPLRYRREGAHVFITGGVLTYWDGSTQRQITTLPAGFRPNAGPIYRVVRANPESTPTTNRVASLRITTAGYMYLDWIYNFSGAAFTNEAWIDCNMDFWTE